MLARTLVLRVALVAVAGTAAGVFPIVKALAPSVAHADDDDDDDDDGGDDEDSGDDGGDEGDEGDDEEEVDEDQPPVTAGGLYTIKTYPQGEIQRPLTMTKGITELRAGIGVDVRNETAFEKYGALGEIRYGYQDNVELRAGFQGTDNFAQWSADAAFEGSIIYDLVDFRAGARLAHAADTTKFSVPLGFPFRYAPKEQVAVVALETAFSINFDTKPDFTPNVGIVIQPQPIIALIVKASLVVRAFNFSDTSSVTVPATGAIQLTPSNRLDAGAEFRFGNVKPPEGVKFYDDRFLTFFVRYRL